MCLAEKSFWNSGVKVIRRTGKNTSIECTFDCLAHQQAFKFKSWAQLVWCPDEAVRQKDSQVIEIYVKQRTGKP